jgi:hypothetical protein
MMPELAVIATIKKTHPQNLMAKFWSEKYYYSLGPEERKRLLACCKSGYENPESEVGIHVVKPEDEKEFKEYFEKVRHLARLFLHQFGLSVASMLPDGRLLRARHCSTLPSEFHLLS